MQDVRKDVADMFSAAREYKVFRDEITRLCKISSNENLHLKVRADKLRALARRYNDGWPFKNNKILSAFRIDGRPVLAVAAFSLSDMCNDINFEREERWKKKEDRAT